MKSLFIANWKCNPTTLAEAKRLFDLIKKGVRNIKYVEVVICPPFPYLHYFILHTSYFKLGAQNCHWVQNGAYTGEVSPAMLKSLGCQYVILGHSERRQYFGETDKIINLKIKVALKAGLKPIFCVGENINDRKEERTKEVLEEQIKIGIGDLAKHWIKDIVIAYEPIWAISTSDGLAATSDEILSANLLIRKIVSEIFGKSSLEFLRILYGGSVTSENAHNFVCGTGMTGLLVGSASLNPFEFLGIIKSLKRCIKP